MSVAIFVACLLNVLTSILLLNALDAAAAFTVLSEAATDYQSVGWTIATRCSPICIVIITQCLSETDVLCYG